SQWLNRVMQRQYRAITGRHSCRKTTGRGRSSAPACAGLGSAEQAQLFHELDLAVECLFGQLIALGSLAPDFFGNRSTGVSDVLIQFDDGAALVAEFLQHDRMLRHLV